MSHFTLVACCMQSAFLMNLFACSSPICLAFGSGLEMMFSLCTTILNDAVSDIWCTRCLCQLEHPLQDRSTLGHVRVRHSATPQRCCMLLLSLSDRFSVSRGLRSRPVSVQVRVSILFQSVSSPLHLSCSRSCCSSSSGRPDVSGVAWCIRCDQSCWTTSP